MYRIKYADFDNNPCEIQIGNGSSTVIDLQAAAEPFVVQYEDDDDIFKPMRLSSGNIKIICDDFDVLTGIMANNPLSRPVKVYCDGDIVWQGFVKSEAYTQRLFSKNEEFSIPVMSCMSALEGVCTGSMTWGDTISGILVKVNDRLGNPFQKFWFPESMGAASYLKVEIQKQNYYDYRSLENRVFTEDETIIFDGQPYTNVINDICTLYGWSMMEVEDKLVFYCGNVAENSFLEYTTAELSSVSSGENTRRGKYAKSVNDLQFFGTDHEIGIVKGKRSVAVSAKLNKPTGTLFSLDDAAGVATHSGFETINRYIDGKWSYLKAKLLVLGNIGAGISVTNYNPSTQYKTVECQNHYESTQACGCFFEEEGIVSGAINTPNYESGIAPCIIIRKDPNSDYYSGSNPSPYYVNIAAIYPVNTQLGEYTKLSFKVECKKEVDDDWSAVDKSDLQIEFGGKTENSSNFSSGNVVMYSTNRASSCKISPFGMNQGAGRYPYMRITNLKLELCTDYTQLGSKVYDDKSEYTSKKEIGLGFADDYSIDCGLATMRLKAYGYGRIDNCPITKPEVMLCDKAYDYYNQSRPRITLVIKSNTYLNPAYSYKYKDKYFNIVGQELNTRDCELKLTLQETSVRNNLTPGEDDDTTTIKLVNFSILNEDSVTLMIAECNAKVKSDGSFTIDADFVEIEDTYGVLPRNGEVCSWYGRLSTNVQRLCSGSALVIDSITHVSQFRSHVKAHSATRWTEKTEPWNVTVTWSENGDYFTATTSEPTGKTPICVNTDDYDDDPDSGRHYLGRLIENYTYSTQWIPYEYSGHGEPTGLSGGDLGMNLILK